MYMCIRVCLWKYSSRITYDPSVEWLDLLHYIMKFYMPKIRMATLLETARADYKETYDSLIKFEQDHCTVHAASVSWLSTNQEGVQCKAYEPYWYICSSTCFQCFSIDDPTWLVHKVEQKTKLRDLFVNCSKKDCSLNHVLSRARPHCLLFFSTFTIL